MTPVTGSPGCNELQDVLMINKTRRMASLRVIVHKYNKYLLTAAMVSGDDETSTERSLTSLIFGLFLSTRFAMNKALVS